ncbi:MAG: methyltransferase [Saprospiraceae bacterium]|nr:methyltransferase [Bacteroidia bacterium]NNE15766.1 methyltransferase [Saprospiraceae bacterium]NNL93018.1 methyltransferase [Saprospiraceae bacterium]
MTDTYFYFKQFKLRNTHAALKVNSDGVLLGAWVDISEDQKVLDVGTGSGIISLMLNQRKPNISITALDIDKASFNEASFNVKLNDITNIEVIHDSVQNFSTTESKFDHIISNLPYFQNDTKPDNNSLKLSKHNETLSFDSFWESAEKLSHHQSKVSVILPLDESKLFIELGKQKQFAVYKQTNCRTRKHKPIKRVLLCFQKNFSGSKFENELVIHQEGQHNYSDDYMNLTKDFYLKM